jgi:dihydroorotase
MKDRRVSATVRLFEPHFIPVRYRRAPAPCRIIRSPQLAAFAMTSLTITRPDDWHLHLRDGAMLSTVLPHTARQFARALVMPNLKPPITTVAAASDYRNRILAALPADTDFTPLMALYLTDNTPPAEIEKAVRSGIVFAVKLYPAGATTNSDFGLTAIEKAHDTIAEMQAHGLPLLIHGEATDPAIDVFDREKAFIDATLIPLLDRFPRLRVVLEHITTEEAAAFVRLAPENVGATITAHHLLYNRNAIFQGGLRPHWYCLPILKREQHRRALLEAATSGNPKFFLGTDSAPHPQGAKESACGCAGCYTAWAALPLYAEAFEAAGAIDKLEGFASFFGADFYGLPRNTGTLTLTCEEQTVPEAFECGGGERLIPLRAKEKLRWRLAD